MYKFHRNQQMSFTDFNQGKEGCEYTVVRHRDKICRAVSERDRYAGKTFTNSSRVADDPEEI